MFSCLCIQKLRIPACSFCSEGEDKMERRLALQPQYLGVVTDVFSTNVQVCQSPVNLTKFIFLVASVFYNGSFNLFLLCLQGFLLSGVFRLCLFFFSCGSESVNDGWLGNMPLWQAFPLVQQQSPLLFSFFTFILNLTHFPSCFCSIQCFGEHTLGQ